MRLYVKFDEYESHHKTDVAKIMLYLQNHGMLYVTMKTVVEKYRDFCDEKASASWLTPDDDTLEEFADWLADIVL